MMKPYGDCLYCGGEVVERLVSVDYRVAGRLYILENVQAGVCRQCGERFFTALVAKKMEEAVEKPAEGVSTISVPVIQVA